MSVPELVGHILRPQEVLGTEDLGEVLQRVDVHEEPVELEEVHQQVEAPEHAEQVLERLLGVVEAADESGEGESPSVPKVAGEVV